MRSCFRKALGGPPNHISLFDLAPRGVCPAVPVTKHAGELLPHHFTHYLDERGWFVFCCTCRRTDFVRRPDVIRLAALRCSDFPLLLSAKATARSASLHGVGQYSKNR